MSCSPVHVPGMRSLLAAVLTAAMVEFAGPHQVKAEERLFHVTLANSPKQYPGPMRMPPGEPTGGLPATHVIEKQYFDRLDPDIGSFAEYWEEVSYAEVTIEGYASAWINLPWAIQPPLLNPGDDNAFDPPVDDPDVERHSPASFYDLNNDGMYTYGQGERIENAFATVIVDPDGDPLGFDNGPFFIGPGSGHVTSAGYPVWKPGERFVDMDHDGRWDGHDEATNMMDWDEDGQPDLDGPWVDLNGDGAPSAATNCIYLPDSDNDGNPDCCPNGPWDHTETSSEQHSGCARFGYTSIWLACPPTHWHTPQGLFRDCNGNLIPDECDINPNENRDAALICAELQWTGPRPSENWSHDRAPHDFDEGSGLVANPNGIPDECEFENFAIICYASPADGTPCVVLEEPRHHTAPRCEYHDANLDAEMDIVEPFENFLRRWDPCIHDPEVSPPNRFADQAHWIKVYDPSSPFAGVELTCSNPSRVVDYGDPSYILHNYPGRQEDIEELVAEAEGRPLIGSHDPFGKLPLSLCMCPDGHYCGDLSGIELPDDYIIPDRACLIGRHIEYNPPDDWINAIADSGPGETTRYTTKMQAAPGTGDGEAKFVSDIFTPEPAWFTQAWGDRYRLPNPDFDPGQPPGPANPETIPAPAPPWPTDGDENIVLAQPFADCNAETFDPDVNRRFFKANAGGVNGNGTGWIGCSAGYDPQIIFETGNLGPVGFEQSCNHSILPDEKDGMGAAPVFYDGWVEHDDLPSSKYHRAGDQYLGEITSPYNNKIWGHDRGPHVPGEFPVPDGVIPAAGPYATDIHGNFSLDGGNLLTMELLTWRTEPPFNDGLAWEHDLDFDELTRFHPYAGLPPMGAGLGFRDFNLDGLIDLGETRFGGSNTEPGDQDYVPGAENYLVDSFRGTANNGSNTHYPFNRRRLVEDCIEVLDRVIDFDDWVDPVALGAYACNHGTPSTQIPVPLRGLGGPTTIFPDGVGSGIVLLPPDAHREGDFPCAPSYYAVHNEDGGSLDTKFPPVGDERINWNLFFHDLPISLSAAGESGLIDTRGFQTVYSAHEYLHTWEGFPDLYDYDFFGPDPNLVNTPVGAWDIMANGVLVHSAPILKEKPCTEWLRSVDLKSVLIPGAEATLTIPAYETTPDKSAYFLENDIAPGERYYFWSAGRANTFDEPGFPGYGDPDLVSGGLPAAGLLIMHTDVGANPDMLPSGQTSGDRFHYLIVQADGEHELEDGINWGDGGDPWPGSTGNTTFTCYTDPAARWYTQNQCTGLEISDIMPDGSGAVTLQLSWIPTKIPGLRFINPPGGSSVDLPPDVIYQVRAEINDLYGGTHVRFFLADEGDDVVIDPDGGNYIASTPKSVPGSTLQAVDWNIAGLPDGEYRVFAELIPGEGVDGVESPATAPRRGRYNVGDGSLTVDDVATNEVVVSGESGFLIDPLTFVGFDPLNNLVNFADAGVTIGDQLAIEGLEHPARGPALRTIVDVSPDGEALTLSAPVTGALPPGGGQWLIVRPDRPARLETWLVTCIDEAGMEWSVTSSLTQPRGPEDDPDPDPYPHAFTGVPYTPVGGEVTFTITGGDIPFARGDRFTFTTTGITALSRSVFIVDGQIREGLGDWDYNGVVDLDDYRAFSTCISSSGPDQAAPLARCRVVFDSDSDHDVDLKDFGRFLAALGASGR